MNTQELIKALKRGVVWKRDRTTNLVPDHEVMEDLFQAAAQALTASQERERVLRGEIELLRIRAAHAPTYPIMQTTARAPAEGAAPPSKPWEDPR